MEPFKEDKSSNATPNVKYVSKMKAYKPRVPFSASLVQDNLDKQFFKFLNVFKKLRINISFLDDITQMPSYAKFLKKILKNKRKLEDFETLRLNKECSAILLNKLPPKLKDSRSFMISCTIGNINFDKALCDLGASINLMPFFCFAEAMT